MEAPPGSVGVKNADGTTFITSENQETAVAQTADRRQVDLCQILPRNPRDPCCETESLGAGADPTQVDNRASAAFANSLNVGGNATEAQQNGKAGKTGVSTTSRSARCASIAAVAFDGSRSLLVMMRVAKESFVRRMAYPCPLPELTRTVIEADTRGQILLPQSVPGPVRMACHGGSELVGPVGSELVGPVGSEVVVLPATLGPD